MIPSLLLKHEMHMSRPPRMPLQQFQQLPHWPIMGDGVADWYNCLEPELAIFVARHDTLNNR